MIKVLHCGEHVILVDEEDFEKVSGYTWYIKHFGQSTYAATNLLTVPGKNQQTLLMHRLLLGLLDKPTLIVDHKDSNGLNNTRNNIRIASRSQNSANAGLRNTNTSGYKGVSITPYGKWIARIGIEGERIHLGTFKTKELAAKTYDLAAFEFFGEYAFLNFPLLGTAVPNQQTTIKTIVNQL